MIIFLAVALFITTYNQSVDKPASNPTTSREIYEAKKRDRQ